MTVGGVPSRAARLTLAVLGGCLLAGAGWLLDTGSELAVAGVTAAAGAAVVAGALTLNREQEGVDAVPVLVWALGGLLVLAAVGAAASLVRQGAVTPNIVRVAMATGGVGTVAGLAGGVQAARRERVEQRAEAAETTADLLSEERTRFEVLNRATRSLLRAGAADEVAETLVTEGRVGVPGSFVAVWLYDADRDRLVPAGVSTTDGERTAEQLWPDDPAFGAFRAGEPTLLTDSEGVPTLAALYAVPLGGHGLLVAGSEAGLDPRERDLVEVYGRNALAALDRIERERELEAQNERLDAFASAVSHDLRNPISVIDGRVDLARTTGDLEQLDYVEEAVDRMRAIIDGVLTLARGEAELDPEPVDLPEVASEAWATVDTRDANLSTEDGTIEADPERLPRLLENLFRNSVEHGGESVTVTVGPLEGGGFYVADDGPGIPPDERDDVFAEGYSGGGGTGLGLAIVSRIAEAHGWTVAVTESGSGGGERGARATPDGSGGARFEFR